MVWGPNLVVPKKEGCKAASEKLEEEFVSWITKKRADSIRITICMVREKPLVVHRLFVFVVKKKP